MKRLLTVFLCAVSITGCAQILNLKATDITATKSITVPSFTSLPFVAYRGNLCYLNTNDSTKGFYGHNGMSWTKLSGSSSGGSGGSIDTGYLSFRINQKFNTADTSFLQRKLMSGINIKTIAGMSLLGSGNIAFPLDKWRDTLSGDVVRHSNIYVDGVGVFNSSLIANGAGYFGSSISSNGFIAGTALQIKNSAGKYSTLRFADNSLYNNYVYFPYKNAEDTTVYQSDLREAIAGAFVPAVTYTASGGIIKTVGNDFRLGSGTLQNDVVLNANNNRVFNVLNAAAMNLDAVNQISITAGSSSNLFLSPGSMVVNVANGLRTSQLVPLNGFAPTSYVNKNYVDNAIAGVPTAVPFNPIAGTNITITGTYPNLTFNSTATGGSSPLLVDTGIIKLTYLNGKIKGSWDWTGNFSDTTIIAESNRNSVVYKGEMARYIDSRLAGFTGGGTSQWTNVSGGINYGSDVTVGGNVKAPFVRLEHSSAPSFSLKNTGAPANQQLTDFYSGGDGTEMRFLNDAFTAANTVFSVKRSGYTPTAFLIPTAFVGIGTNSPGFPLTVNGMAQMSGLNLYGGAGTGKTLLRGGATGSTYWDYPEQLFANSTTAVTAGSDVEITDLTKGIILKSPNGTRFRLTVNNDGSLTTNPL